MTDAETLQRRLFDLGQGSASSAVGVVVDQDWDSGLVTVDVGGTPQTMSWQGVAAPWLGDRVRVLTAGGRPVCQAIGGAGIGTVQTTSGGIATVTGDDGVTYAYPHLGSAPANGSRVRIDHAGRCIPAGAYAAEPPGSEFTRSPAPPTAARQTRTFRPIDSANWWPGGGRWDSQFVEISDTRSGFYFYGSQIADSIPNTADIVSASLALVELWDNVPGVPSQLGTHTAKRRPSSPPALSGVINASGSGQLNILPFANALADGVAFGVGFRAGAGWRRFDTFARSGAITITWQN